MKNQDLCPICGQFLDVICSGFRKSEFIDGRKYSDICFVCFSVPKNFEGIELNNLEEMQEFGFDVSRAKMSIKAVKKLIKNK